LRRKWGPDGALIVEQLFQNGKRHGRYWELGHQELWYWEGKQLTAKEFESRSAAGE
jgi:hypothetical protein